MIPKTSTITIRLPMELIHQIEHFSEVLRIRPSSLCAMILEDKLKEWVKEYASKLDKEVKKL